MRVPIVNDTVSLGLEMFASSDERVISWKGRNYYLACGAEVTSGSGGTTSCIKPLHHETITHEDYAGYLRTATGVVSTSEEIRSRLMTLLERTGLDRSEAFNVVNALSANGYTVSRES